MAILVLAANTAFSDFPRLAYFLARDKYMPRQFTFRGDRLAFTTGIVTLGLVAALVLLASAARSRAADPALRARRLHLVHDLASSACSRAGAGDGSRAGKSGQVINLVGAAATGLVAVVVAITKFTGRRLDDRDRDRAADLHDARDPQALQDAVDRAGGADAARSGRDPAHRDRADRGGQPGGAADAGLRPLDLRRT